MKTNFFTILLASIFDCAKKKQTKTPIPRALLSYISIWEFSRALERCETYISTHVIIKTHASLYNLTIICTCAFFYSTISLYLVTGLLALAS